MTNMRRQQILELLAKRKFMRVTELAATFGVSEITIRKDLTAMEEDGLVVRSHGKVALPPNDGIPYRLRNELNNLKKLSIAKVAVDMLSNVRSVALDAGTTTSLIAQLMVNVHPMSIVTNSLTAANILAASNHSVSVTGGVLLAHSMCMIGPDAEEFLSRVKTDIAVVGCTGVRADGGFCTGIRFEASVKHAVLNTGMKTVAVLDDSKFSVTGMNAFASVDEVDTIITTHGAEELENFRRLQDRGTEVIFADDIYPLSK